MTIYIPDIWCGVIFTILAEFAILFIAAGVRKFKKDKREK